MRPTVNLKKLKKLSPGLRKKIFREPDYGYDSRTPVTNFLTRTKKHCNAGRTTEAGMWLKKYCDNGGKIFLTMSGAGSSFQMGVVISELIRAGKIAAISVTGANMEESLYRLLAHKYYANIPQYADLTPLEEKELDRAGFRRITDTFLPEDESVRMVLKKLEKLWRKAAKEGKSYLWHEFFFQLFETGLIKYQNLKTAKDCWLLQAYLHKIPVIVPGWEDSTMGNIFTHGCYDGKHPFLKKYKLEKPYDWRVVRPNIGYMHDLAEWYIDTTRPAKTRKRNQLAFVQLGGGIAADFPICVVPHLKKDYLAEEKLEKQESLIPTWKGFIEISPTHMSQGSYTGAGSKEKITWSKLEPNAYGVVINGDYTEHFPDIAALVLGW